MNFSVAIPDELAPLIEDAFIERFGGQGDGYSRSIPDPAWTATVPNPESNPGDDPSWVAEIPNPQPQGTVLNPVTPMQFAGQYVAKMIVDIVLPFAHEQAIAAARAAVDAQFQALPPITISGA